MNREVFARPRGLLRLPEGSCGDSGWASAAAAIAEIERWIAPVKMDSLSHTLDLSVPGALAGPIQQRVGKEDAKAGKFNRAL